MTDEPAEQLDPLSPADEARIRALLSDARATGSMPAHVAARLDDAIVGLAAERERALDSGYQGNVTPLVRTKRHRAAAVLGAAAAVTVLGLGIGTFFDGSDDGGDGAMPADTGVDRGTAPAEDGDSELSDAKRTEGDVLTEAEPELVIGSAPFRVHARQLGRDLAQLRAQVLPDPRAADYAAAPTYAPEGFTCRSTATERTVLVGVRYDGAPAYAAFQEPMGDSQVVEVLQCGTGDVLRSTTLPLPD